MSNKNVDLARLLPTLRHKESLRMSAHGPAVDERWGTPAGAAPAGVPCRVPRATSTHKRLPWVVGVVCEPSSLSRPLAAALEHHRPPTRARSGSVGGHAPADR